MSYAEWWWSQTGGDGPDPDPGDPIGQSLRFRGAQNLIGPNLTQTLGTNTMSMWVKKAGLANNLGLYGTSFRGYGVYFNGSDVLTPNTNTLVASSSVYRDTSAWCHFVFNADGAFCNGERVPAFAYDNNLYVADASDAMVVGAIHTSTYYFNGYIAEVHFIDGSSLEPTTFGRFNAEGVWVPVDPGLDGDLGITFNGLSYLDPAISLVSGSPHYIFKEWDGNYQTSIWYLNGDGVNPSVIRVNLDTPIDNVTNIKFHGGDYSAPNPWILKVDGVQVGTGATSGNAVTEESVSFSSRTVNYIELEASSAGASLGNVKLNDVLLASPNGYGANGFHLDFADPTNIGNDVSGNGNHFTATGFELTTTGSQFYDSMPDSPTQNGITYQSLVPNAGYDGPYYANSQYDMTNLVYGTLPCTGGVNFDEDTGSYQFEFLVRSIYGAGPDIGAAPADEYFNTNGLNIAGTAASPRSFKYAIDGNKYQNGGATAFGAGYTTGNYVQLVFNTSNGEITAYKDGVSQGVIQDNCTGVWIPTGGAVGNAHGAAKFSNFNNPIANTNPISSESLGTPTIPNGRDHFQAITGPGQGNITSTVTNVQETNQVETHFTANATLTPQNNTDLLGVRVYMSGGSGAGGSAAYLDGLGGGPTAIGSNGNDTEWRTRFLTRTELNGSGAFTAGAGGTINSSGAGNYGGGAGQLSQFVTNGGGITLTAAGSNGGAGRYVPAGTNAVYTSAGGIASAGNMTVVDTTYTAIDGGKGAPGRNMPGTTNGSPGNTGQMYSLELYPTTSGIGVPSAVVILTLDNTTGLANINVGNTVENLNGTAEGTVVFIDGSTIYIEQTTGQFAINDRLVTSGAGNGLLGLAQETFPSGLWWIKDRANANQHQLVDSVRGDDKALNCPSVGAEVTYTPPTGDSVAWCWSAPEVFTPTSTSPTIDQMTGARNIDAGFSIVRYNSTSAAAFTMEHGLSKAPDFLFTKPLNQGNQFYVYHSALGSSKWLALDATTTAVDYANFWVVNDTEWGAAAGGGATLAGPHVTYSWTAIPGYSAFGSYTGNGSADGPFVYLGFRPAFVLIKSSNTTYQWMIVDSTRNVTNPVNSYLFPNLTNAEQTASTFDLDFVSNGFKLRSSTATDNNASGITYIYAAFAENPFQSPVTAR